MHFEAYSTSHWLVLICSGLILMASVFAARRSLGQWLAVGFGTVLLLNYLAYNLWRANAGFWEARYDLPFEFCNWAAFVTIIACYTGRKAFIELSYFWVMAGSFQGVITPDLRNDFPHPYFFMFFIAHAGLVVASLYLIIGLRKHPGPGSPWRALGWAQLYFACALLADVLLESNYGYMMRKPEAASLLDYLGPWPWYLLSFEGVALVFFWLLYLPFYWLSRRSQEPKTS